MNISIGIFAHNEEEKIGAIIKNISDQSILKRLDLNVTVYILANGCRDNTAQRAEDQIRSITHLKFGTFNLCKISEGGKSRTWNLFVHKLAPEYTNFFIFIDADISLVEDDTLEKMYERILHADLHVFNSRPIKDLVFQNRHLSLIEKLILKSAGTLDSYKTAICGQLYIARAEAAKEIYLPIGLPVEDGFIRAMMLTDLLTNNEALDRISGRDDIFHVYESINSIGELLRHQTRIIIGSAINEAIFRFIREMEAKKEARKALLIEASEKEDWLYYILKKQLPKWPYGFISFHYLTKRISAFKEGRKKNPNTIILTFLGFSFDLIVYLLASIKMWRGHGVGYW